MPQVLYPVEIHSSSSTATKAAAAASHTSTFSLRPRKRSNSSSRRQITHTAASTNSSRSNHIELESESEELRRYQQEHYPSRPSSSLSTERPRSSRRERSSSQSRTSESTQHPRIQVQAPTPSVPPIPASFVPTRKSSLPLRDYENRGPQRTNSSSTTTSHSSNSSYSSTYSASTYTQIPTRPSTGHSKSYSSTSSTSQSHSRSTSYQSTTPSKSNPTRSRRSKMPTYFLTGAARGIGLEFVRQLSVNPNVTVIAGVRSKSGDAATSLSELEALNTHGNLHIIECDVGDLDSLSSLEFRVVEILSRTGANLDFLFNVAGINATSSDTSLNIDPASLQRHMNTNVLGPAKIVEVLRKHLSRGATVLNLTSGLGSLTVATEITKCCTYSMSKAALNMLTVHQAKDLKGQGVKVACVDPGWVKTKMGGKGAMLEPADSVASMLDLVAGLTEADSGKFFNYNGTAKPW